MHTSLMTASGLGLGRQLLRSTVFNFIFFLPATLHAAQSAGI